MCFRIDSNAKRPKRKHAYKIVQITSNGLVRSLCYDDQYWQCNKSYRLGLGAITVAAYTSAVYGTTHLNACEGIYVYDTAHAARAALGPNAYHVIMKVEVDPADWLYSSGGDKWYFAHGVSTYRKVYVPEEQPYMEWY